MIYLCLPSIMLGMDATYASLITASMLNLIGGSIYILNWNKIKILVLLYADEHIKIVINAKKCCGM